MDGSKSPTEAAGSAPAAESVRSSADPAAAAAGLRCDACGTCSPEGTCYCRTCGRALAPDPLVGQTIDGRYTITRALGFGGMGVVYEAKHTRLAKRFAVKVVHAQFAQVGEFGARFEREALAASRLRHAHCLEVSDFGQLSSGQLYLVMEYLEGRPLGELLEAPQPLSFVLEVATQILRGLQHAHGLGLVHRDVKPDNVMLLDSADGAVLVKLVDFGLAKPLEGAGTEQITQYGTVLGTPTYMAPEQAAGKPVDVRADLYAVGVLIWRLLLGRPPFEATDPLQVLALKVSRPAPRLRDVAPGVFPAELDLVLSRALVREPAERYGSAEAFLADLAAVPATALTFDEAAVPSEARGRDNGPTRPARSWRVLSGRAARAIGGLGAWLRAGRPRTWVAALALVLALIGAALAVRLGQDTSAKRPLEGPPNPLPPSEPNPADRRSPGATAGRDAPAKRDKDPDRADLSPALGEKLAAARTALLRRECSAALAAASVVAAEVPGSARAHYYRGAALACARKHGQALRAYARTIELDRRYALDKRILQDVARMLRTKTDRARALAFLQQQVGQPAIPLLVRLSRHRKREIRASAVRSLGELGASDQVDWVATLALDLDQTPSCRGRVAIVNRLRDLGDPRAIPLLERARDRRTRVLGLFRGGYRHGCVRSEIIGALEALRQRSSPPP